MGFRPYVPEPEPTYQPDATGAFDTFGLPPEAPAAPATVPLPPAPRIPIGQDFGDEDLGLGSIGRDTAPNRFISDSANSLAKGAIGLGEFGAGVADTALTLNPANLGSVAARAAARAAGYDVPEPEQFRVGPALESAGWRPKETRQFLAEQDSPELQAARAEVAKAKGFLPSLEASLQNPSTIVQGSIESLPSMAAGGGVSRTLLRLAPEIAPAIAAGFGEGLVQTGQAAEGTRQETGTLTPVQAAAAGVSGAIDAVISRFAGHVADKLKIPGADPDVLMTGAKGAAGVDEGLVKRVVGGLVREGLLEELPQSAQEQFFQNVATGRPWMEGVAEAGVQGGLSGALMGGGANVFGGESATEPPAPGPEPAQNRGEGPVSAPTAPIPPRAPKTDMAAQLVLEAEMAGKSGLDALLAAGMSKDRAKRELQRVRDLVGPKVAPAKAVDTAEDRKAAASRPDADKILADLVARERAGRPSPADEIASFEQDPLANSAKRTRQGTTEEIAAYLEAAQKGIGTAEDEATIGAISDRARSEAQANLENQAYEPLLRRQEPSPADTAVRAEAQRNLEEQWAREHADQFAVAESGGPAFYVPKLIAAAVKADSIKPLVDAGVPGSPSQLRKMLEKAKASVGSAESANGTEPTGRQQEPSPRDEGKPETGLRGLGERKPEPGIGIGIASDRGQLGEVGQEANGIAEGVNTVGRPEQILPAGEAGPIVERPAGSESAQGGQGSEVHGESVPPNASRGTISATEAGSETSEPEAPVITARGRDFKVEKTRTAEGNDAYLLHGAKGARYEIVKTGPNRFEAKKNQRRGDFGGQLGGPEDPLSGVTFHEKDGKLEVSHETPRSEPAPKRAGTSPEKTAEQLVRSVDMEKNFNDVMDRIENDHARRMAEQEAIPQRLEESVRNTRREGVQGKPAVAPANEVGAVQGVKAVQGAEGSGISDLKPQVLQEGEAGGVGGIGRNPLVADEAPKAVEAQGSAPEPAIEEERSPPAERKGQKADQVGQQTRPITAHAESVPQPSLTGKPQEAATVPVERPKPEPKPVQSEPKPTLEGLDQDQIATAKVDAQNLAKGLDQAQGGAQLQSAMSPFYFEELRRDAPNVKYSELPRATKALARAGGRKPTTLRQNERGAVVAKTGIRKSDNARADRENFLGLDVQLEHLIEQGWLPEGSTVGDLVAKLIDPNPSFHPGESETRDALNIAEDVARETGIRPPAQANAIKQDKDNPKEIQILKALVKLDPNDSQVQLEAAKDRGEISDAQEPAKVAEDTELAPWETQPLRRSVSTEKTKAGTQVLLPEAEGMMDTTGKVGALKRGQEDVNRGPLFTQAEEAEKKADAAKQRTLGDQVEEPLTKVEKPKESRSKGGDAGSVSAKETSEGMSLGTEGERNLVRAPAFLEKLNDLLNVPVDTKATGTAAKTVEGTPATPERLRQRVLGHAQALRDILGGKTFTEQPFSSRDAEAKRLVLDHVLGLGHNREVLDAVVKLVPVDVMNDLVATKRTPDVLFNDRAMLQRTLASGLGPGVAARGDLADSLVRAITLAGAEVGSGRVVSDLVGPSRKAGSAGRTDNLDHGNDNTRNGGETVQTKETDKGVAMFDRPNEQTTEEAWQHYDSKDGEKTTLSPTAYRDGGRIVGAPPDVRVVDFMGDVDKSVLTDMAKSRASLAHYVSLAERQIQRAVPGFKFGGFTPAGNLHGVNFQGRVFLNDLATHQIALEIVAAERITYPEAYARAMWDVISHEGAHYAEKGHGVEFLAELDRIETEVGPQAIRAIKRDFMRYASEEKHRTQTQKMYEKALPGWREGERRGREAAARAETRSGGLRTSPDVATGLFPRPRGDTRDSEGVRGEGDEPQGSLFAPDGNQAEGLAAPAFVRGTDGRGVEPPAPAFQRKPAAPTPEELKDPTFWEKAMEARRAFILASWRFLGGNVAGNTISQLSGLAEIPLTAFWDRKMNPGERRVFAEELNRAVSAIVSIGPEASKKLGTDLWDTIKQKENLGSNENEEGKYEQQHRAIGGGKNSSPAERKLGTAIRTILRMAEITDRFYKTLSWEQSTSRQAYRIARSEGLLGAAASSRADKLMEDFRTTFGSREAALKELRSDKGTPAQRRMLENSHRESRYRTYTLPANAENAGWFGEIAHWIKAAEKWSVVGPIVQSQFLFKNTPANVAFQGFERSPLAWFSVREKLSALNDLKKKIEAAPDADTRAALESGLDKKAEAATDAMARATMGSAIAAIGFGLAAAGLLTGSGPPDPDDREQWMNAGNIPNAIKIGDRWFAFDKLDSMTTALALAANLTQAKNEKDASKMGGAFLNALQSAFIDNSYLNSFGRLSDTISLATKDFGGAISKWLQNVEGSFVPAFVRQTAEYVDPVVRSKRGWIAPIKSGIPGLSKSLPAVRTGTGEPAKRTQRLGESTLGPLSPFGFMRTGDAKGDPLAKEFMAADYAPEAHKDYISIGVGPVGAKVQHRVTLTEKELEVFRTADEQTTKRLREIIKSDAWGKLSEEQKKGYFQKVYAAMGAKAKEAVMPGVVARLRSTLGARK